MFVERTSPRTPEEIRSAIPAILARYGFVLWHVHDLSDMYMKIGHHVGGDLCVFEISNPDLGKDSVRALPQCTVFMPYRISMYVREGRTRLATLLPTKVAEVLPIPPDVLRATRGVGREYEARLLSVLKDLCRPIRPGRTRV